jgi:hypothetical protein
VTAPDPSPLERAEITRFGVFDDEVIAELEEQFDDGATS